jgi:anti-sigma factor RsiW
VDGLDALYWANSQVTCTIVGDLTRSEMEEIAAAVFAALGWQTNDYQIG